MKNKTIMAATIAAALTVAGSASAVTTFDDNVTPVNGVVGGMIFGGGNSNGSFTVDREGSVELGLRGKLRHNGSGIAENTFNSNGDGTYSFAAGVAPTQSAPTGVWSFEWAINTDYNDTTGFNLGDLTYELGIDFDPGAGTSFVAFDPIHTPNPGQADGHWDHSIGDNTTGGGAGSEATDIASYNALVANNNVAQQSWKAHWYIPGFDPTVDGVYDFYLSASDGSGEIARTEIQIIVGAGAPIPEPATMTLLGLGLAGLGLRARKRKSA